MFGHKKLERQKTFEFLELTRDQLKDIFFENTWVISKEILPEFEEFMINMKGLYDARREDLRLDGIKSMRKMLEIYEYFIREQGNRNEILRANTFLPIYCADLITMSTEVHPDIKEEAILTLKEIIETFLPIGHILEGDEYKTHEKDVKRVLNVTFTDDKLTELLDGLVK